jgi:hypothetical protein
MTDSLSGSVSPCTPGAQIIQSDHATSRFALHPLTAVPLCLPHQLGGRDGESDQGLSARPRAGRPPRRALVGAVRAVSRTRRPGPDLPPAVRATVAAERANGLLFFEIRPQLRRLNLPRDRLAKIGWTRWQAIHGHITPANARQLLKLAEEKTVAELQAELRGAGYTKKPRSVNLKFSVEDYVKFERVLLRHGARRRRGGRGLGLEGKEEAILKILDVIEKFSPGACDDD